MKDILAGIDENEPLEVEITSEGGSVFAGIQIANMLARWKGKVTTHAVGFVASIATVILMAGKSVVVDSNCFCLIHLPWTMVTGNANDLNKEIETLEKCKHAMMSFYMRHAKVDAQTIEDYLADESWFLGEELAQIFSVEVLQNDEQLDIAAKYDLSKYKNLPRGLNMKNKKAEQTPIEEEVKEEIVEEVTEQKQEQELPPDEETKVEEVVEEITKDETTEEEEKTTEELKEEIESLKARVAELEKENEELKAKCGDEKAEEVPSEEEETTEETTEEVVTKEEADKRVSGMQAKMQSQVNALSTEINNFKHQLQAKEEELKSAKADITSLNQKLDESTKELSEMASALSEKTQALAKLNASVNAHAEELPTMEEGLAKCKSPSEKVAFLSSGKYIR